MNQPNDQGKPAQKPSALRLIIIGVIVFVVSLGGMGLAMKLLSPHKTEPVEAAGAAAFDVDRARTELDDLQQRAMQVMSAKQSVDMVPPARAFIEKYPRFAPGYLLLGQVYIHQRNFDAGYDALEMSLRYDSQQPEVQQLAGTIAQSLGRMEQASVHYAHAVALDPANAKLRVFLAQSYIQQNRFDEARMALLEALRINSHLHEAYYGMSTLDAKQGNVMQAITQVNRAIEHLPEDAGKYRESYVRWLAKLLQRDNRPEESIQALQQLDETQQRSPAVLEDFAIAWQMIGQPAYGAKLYEEALAHKPDDWSLAAGAAKWYLKANDKPSAKRMTDAIRRINPAAPILTELNQQVQP